MTRTRSRRRRAAADVQQQFNSGAVRCRNAGAALKRRPSGMSPSCPLVPHHIPPDDRSHFGGGEGERGAEAEMKRTQERGRQQENKNTTEIRWS